MPPLETEETTSSPAHQNCHEHASAAGAKPEKGLSFHFRLMLFLGISLLVIGTATWILLPPSGGSGADRNLQISMSGWLPGDVTISANQAVTIQITNSESPFHDGGGLHNLVIPELNMKVDIPPKSTKVIALPPMAAGTYTFYCDVCCGGKENPSMRGVLMVGQVAKQA